MKTKQTLLAGIAVLALPAAVRAQLHIDGGGFHIAAGAVVAVRGDVTSNGTDITGDGTLMLNGTGAQNLGMNGGDIPVLEINNSNNITLTSAARIEDQLTLTTGHVFLGASNLIFDPSAGIVGAAAAKHLVTNGAGFVQKEDISNGSSFVFPVGVAAGDLTQAALTNVSAAPRDYSVQVKTYATSGATEGNVVNGVDRTWQIFADAAASANVALQHNASSEGASFNRNDAYVTRQTAAGMWTLGSGEAAQTPNFTHDSVLAIPALADATSFFSKTDDEFNSLNPAGQIAVKVFLQGPYVPASGLMTNNIQAGVGISGFSSCKLPTNDPYGLGAVYTQACNPAGPAGAVTDWVRADIYTVVGSTETLQQSRALLLQRDGDVVDLDGGVPAFRAQSGSVSRVVIRHRNHLAVSSNNLPSPITDGALIAYNFTTSLGQAFNNGNHNDQMRQASNGVYTLFSGDIANSPSGVGNGFIDNQDQALLGNAIGAGNQDDTYTPTDLNLNGFVDNQDQALLNGNIPLGLTSVTIEY